MLCKTDNVGVVHVFPPFEVQHAKLRKNVVMEGEPFNHFPDTGLIEISHRPEEGGSDS